MPQTELPRRRWPRRIAIAAAVLLAFAIGLIGWLQPTLAAFVCPQCLGFERLSGKVYVERTMEAGSRDALQAAMADAERRLRIAYGELHTAPIILACATEACWHRLGGGGARGGAYANIGLRLSPRGLNSVIIAHERSHIELHHRIGLWRFARGAVPSWFDEGFAVIVSDDARYLRPAGEGDRCRVEPAASLPSDQRAWGRQAGADHNLYAGAACRVSRWMIRNGGTGSVLSALDRIGAGAPFAAVVAE